MSLKVLLVLVATVLVLVPARPAAGAMGPGGCPAGYVAFDRQTGEGGPPSYRQGETVAASGVITNTDAGVTEVALRWGSADGPELGRAGVDASGSWKGITFQIPQDVADGEQQVFYVARDRAGQMLPGLPYPFAVNVGAPAAPAAREAPPVATSPAVARRPGTSVTRPGRPSVTAVAPPGGETVRSPAPVRSKAAPAVRSQVAAPPRARTRTAATDRPSQRERRSPRSARSPRGVRPPSETERAVDRPDSGTLLTRSARSVTPRGASPARASASVVTTGIAEDGISNAKDAAPVLAAVGLLLLVGVGAYGAGVVAGRRRGDSDGGTAAGLVTPEVVCPIESELQAMLAAEREEATGGHERRDAAPLK